MRTDADDLARVRDPAIELLLSHTATLTDRGAAPMCPTVAAAGCGGVLRRRRSRGSATRSQLDRTRGRSRRPLWDRPGDVELLDRDGGEPPDQAVIAHLHGGEGRDVAPGVGVEEHLLEQEHEKLTGLTGADVEGFRGPGGAGVGVSEDVHERGDSFLVAGSGRRTPRLDHGVGRVRPDRMAAVGRHLHQERSVNPTACRRKGQRALPLSAAPGGTMKRSRRSTIGGRSGHDDRSERRTDHPGGRDAGPVEDRGDRPDARARASCSRRDRCCPMSRRTGR